MQAFRFYLLLPAILLSIPVVSWAQSARKDNTLARPSSPSSSNKTGGVVIRQGQDAQIGTPSRAIQDLETKMEEYKTSVNLTAAERENNAKIKHDIITGTFDIRELCRLSLDKHWGTRSANEQNQFVDLMTRLLEKKGILSKEQSKTQGKKYVVKYLGDTFLDASKTRAKTKTSIHVPKEDVNISIDYKLVKNGPIWKVFDIIVDDASLVDNYKYQFNSIIVKNGYADLVSRIQKKLDDVGAKS